MGYTTAKRNMDNCGCSQCAADLVRARQHRNAAAMPVAETPKAEKLPKGLSAIRKTVIEYLTNPQKFADMSAPAKMGKMWRDNDNGESEQVATITFYCRSFEEVTGLKKLGSGHYSDVYALDETRVLKIVKQGDSGYRRFVNTIRGVKNIFLPKIYYSGEWAGKQVYILERLSNVPGADKENGLDYDSRDLKDSFRAALRSVGRGGSNPFMVASPELVAVAKIMSEGNFDNDLHGDNIMFRGDTPVITDPCSEGY